MKILLHDERLGKMAADLAGVDGVRIWHDQALIKMPWANPTSWHQDNPKWSFTSDVAISIWIALDDVTGHNGCIFFCTRIAKGAVQRGSSQGADVRNLHPESRARGNHPGSRPNAGRELLFPQWVDSPRRWSKYDAGFPSCDDMRVYARRKYI